MGAQLKLGVMQFVAWIAGYCSGALDNLAASAARAGCRHHELLSNYPIAFFSALFMSNVFFFYARHKAASRDLGKDVDAGAQVWRAPHNSSASPHPTICGLLDWETRPDDLF